MIAREKPGHGSDGAAERPDHLNADPSCPDHRNLIPPGATRMRIGERTWEMPDAVWELWVRRGAVPPEAMVLSHLWTRGVWRHAGSLEVYHLFLPVPEAGPGDSWTGRLPEAVPGPEWPGASPKHERLPVALWGPGISVTQALVLINLLVSAGLVWLWRDNYSENLWRFSGTLRSMLGDGMVWVLVIPLFLHASSGHLMGNMLGLVAGGAAVEEFYGRIRTVGMYLFAGLCGAGFSLLREHPVLSVGASGAIMGLYGIVLVFLLRYRGRFSEREKLKTTRVYFPLLVLALVPSLFGADFYAHLGGFLGGILAALILPPIRSRLPGGAPSRAEERA